MGAMGERDPEADSCSLHCALGREVPGVEGQAGALVDEEIR